MTNRDVQWLWNWIVLTTPLFLQPLSFFCAQHLLPTTFFALIDETSRTERKLSATPKESSGASSLVSGKGEIEDDKRAIIQRAGNVVAYHRLAVSFPHSILTGMSLEDATGTGACSRKNVPKKYRISKQGMLFDFDKYH